MAFSFQGWKIPSGYLKILQVILGAICVGLIGYYNSYNGFASLAYEVYFFMLVTYSCLFTSFILMLAYLEESTVEKVKNSTFEILYHVLACIFYISATIAFFIILSKEPSSARKGHHYAAHVVACVCGAINTGLYFLNAFIAFKCE